MEKCLSILDLLSKSPGGMRIKDISQALNLPASSIHHMLATLLPHNYVMQDPETKKYSLGLKLVDLGHSALENFDIRKPAARHMRRLNERTGAAVHLSVFRGGKFIYIEKIGAPSGLALVTYVGFATDPHAASGGKVLLADMTEPEVRALYPGGRLKQYSKNTISTHRDLLAELARIREQGYALDDEEYYEGVRCVAAPVKRGGVTVASISVTGSIYTMSRERIENEIIGLVKETAQAVSDEL